MFVIRTSGDSAIKKTSGDFTVLAVLVWHTLLGPEFSKTDILLVFFIKQIGRVLETHADFCRSCSLIQHAIATPEFVIHVHGNQWFVIIM